MWVLCECGEMGNVELGIWNVGNGELRTDNGELGNIQLHNKEVGKWAG